MHFYKKCWFDLFKKQFISYLNFGKNYFVQLRWNWFSVRLPVTNVWNCHSLYTTFSSTVGVWGMWACSIFLSFIYIIICWVFLFILFFLGLFGKNTGYFPILQHWFFRDDLFQYRLRGKSVHILRWTSITFQMHPHQMDK